MTAASAQFASAVCSPLGSAPADFDPPPRPLTHDPNTHHPPASPRHSSEGVLAMDCEYPPASPHPPRTAPDYAPFFRWPPPSSTPSIPPMSRRHDMHGNAPRTPRPAACSVPGASLRPHPPWHSAPPPLEPPRSSRRLPSALHPPSTHSIRPPLPNRFPVSPTAFWLFWVA